MKPSIYNRICAFLSALWMSFCGIALLVVLLFRNRVDYYAKTEPVLSTVAFMFLLAGILSAAYLRTGQKKKSTVQAPEIPQWIILPFSVALFVLQAVQQYNIFFLTNWDSSQIVYLATQIASPDYTGTVSSYLSMYPNNTLLTWLYACLFPMLLSVWYLLRGKEKQPHAAALLLFLGSLVLVRCLVLNNHSYLHCFFTHRALVTLVFSLLASVWLNISLPQKKRRQK